MLSKKDQAIVDDMIVRERNMKNRQRVIGVIMHKRRLFKQRLVTYAAILTTVGFWVLYIGFARYDNLSIINIIQVNVLMTVILLFFNFYIWQRLVNYKPMQLLIKRYNNHLRVQYAGALLASKRWLQFYYHKREISRMIPQILYFLQTKPQFTSIDQVIAYIDEQNANPHIHQNDLQKFRKFINQTNEMMLSTSDKDGRPSSRQMRFIVLDEPNVWYFGTAPDTPKIEELDRGLAAIHTLPTKEGMTIASNRLRVYRSQYKLDDLADYYNAQVPGFMDSLSPEDRQREIIYAIELKSARLDSWTQHEEVTFIKD